MNRYYIIASNGRYYVIDSETSETVYASRSQDDAVATCEAYNDMFCCFFG